MIEQKSSAKFDVEQDSLEINLQGKTLREMRDRALENIEEFWAQQANNFGLSKLITWYGIENGIKF